MRYAIRISYREGNGPLVTKLFAVVKAENIQRFRNFAWIAAPYGNPTANVTHSPWTI